MQRRTGWGTAFLSFVAASQAHAAGFALQEQGASGLGNAYAGAAAVAEDATTVWWNPAGMARLAPGKHLSLGGAYVGPSTQFHDAGSQPAAGQALGGEGGDAGDTAFVPSLFFAMDLGPRWNFGLAVTVPFGLSTKYDSTWLGRFQGVESKVETVNINPALSFKLSDAVSVGGGISYQHGKIDLHTAANYTAIGAAFAVPVLPGTEGQNATSVDGHAWGYNFGVLFNASPLTRVGVHYRSSLDYDLDGSTSFSNRPAGLAPIIPDGDVKLSLQTPDSAAISVAHEAGPRVLLLADATWTHWGRIQGVPLVRTSGAQSGATLDTLTFNFHDTWRFSVGMNYRLSETTLFKVGFAYDKTPVPNAETRSVRLPDSDRTWLSLGAALQVSPADKLDLGYTYVMARDADISNNQQPLRGLVNGSYETTIHVLGVQYQHSF
jgi:long-chain fatty acid transport protein